MAIESQGRKFSYPVIIGVIVAVGVFVVVASSFSGGQYAVEMSQVAEAPGKYQGKFVRVVGNIKHGSTQRLAIDGKPETRFSIVDASGNELDIIYYRTPADAYEEGRECIVEGRLIDDRTIECDKLTVKCPSKYQTEDGGGARPPGYYQKNLAPSPAPAPAGGPSS